MKRLLVLAFASISIASCIIIAANERIAVKADCEQAYSTATPLHELTVATSTEDLLPFKTPQINHAQNYTIEPNSTVNPTAPLYNIDNADSLSKMLNSIDAKLQQRIDDISKQVAHDALVVRYVGSRSGQRINNWPDIIALCCVMYNMAPNDLESSQIDGVWRDMTAITYSRDTSTYQNEDGYTVDCVTLSVYVTAIRAKTACAIYGLSPENISKIDSLLGTPTFYYTVIGVIGDSMLQANAMRVVHLSLTAEQYANEFLRLAATRLGDPYSQAMRGKDDYVDCSYLVWWTMQQTGAYTGEDFPSTAYRQAEWCFRRNMEIKPGNLEIGDLVFYTYQNADGSWKRTNKNDVPERIKHVSHVAIYAGEGKVIEAIGVGVTYSDLGNPTFCAALFR